MLSTIYDAEHSADTDRLASLVDAISDHAIYMLDDKGFVATWNKGAERITQYTAAEILGQHFSRFFITEDQAKRVPERMVAIARKDGRHDAEGWRVRKDGSHFRCDSSLHESKTKTAS